MLWSLVGVTIALLFLGSAFWLSETHSPPVALDSECPAFEGTSCTDCIRQVCLQRSCASERTRQNISMALCPLALLCMQDCIIREE